MRLRGFDHYDVFIVYYYGSVEHYAASVACFTKKIVARTAVLRNRRVIDRFARASRLFGSTIQEYYWLLISHSRSGTPREPLLIYPHDIV